MLTAPGSILPGEVITIRIAGLRFKKDVNEERSFWTRLRPPLPICNTQATRTPAVKRNILMRRAHTTSAHAYFFHLAVRVHLSKSVSVASA